MIDLLSLMAEMVATVLGLMIALQKKKSYGWLIAFTFAVYVFYDSARFPGLNTNTGILNWLFLLASLSVFGAVWQIYRPRK